MNKVLNSKAKYIEEDDKYILKPTDKDIEELFSYLHSRGFDNIPEIIESSNEGIKYKYIENKNKDDMSRKLELSKLLSFLHYKTSYHKDVSKHKYREIYDKLIEKIEYIENYYNELMDKIEMEIYPSPSHYLIERNFSIILGSINFIKSETKRWFKLVQDKTKERVCIVNNNPKKEHVIIGDKSYLTNRDSYMVDTPIIDLYKLYKVDNNYKDFYDLYKEYSKNFNLTNEEKKLFFIMISIPPKIDFLDNEILYTKIVNEVINYQYKTNEFIKLINSEKEVNNKSN
jgi:hypothetical protein